MTKTTTKRRVVRQKRPDVPETEGFSILKQADRRGRKLVKRVVLKR